MTEQPISKTEQHLAEQLSQHYTINERAADFLQQQRHLYPVLVTAAQKIEEFFGENSELELRLVSDPEIPEYRKLFAYIWTRLPVNAALEQLDHFEEDWYLDLDFSIRDKVTFDVQFR